MKTTAVVLEQPERLVLSELELTPAGDEDVVVDIDWSGVSTGTERLLWSGRMPPFPGMGYPLVPGYESIGRISSAGRHSQRQVGESVFVPGARCFGPVRGLFGGAAARVVVPGSRVIPIDSRLGEEGVLMALAATAYHVISSGTGTTPDLIVGHGVLGRLLARIVVATGARAPTVWERNPARRDGAEGYEVIAPEDDTRTDYQCICDVSGDPRILDTLVARLRMGGEIVLAGFYDERMSFEFPAAFMREARFRVAAQWQPADLVAVKQLAESGQLSLNGLITHRCAASDADAAYRTAFNDPSCLKMILNWSNLS